MKETDKFNLQRFADAQHRVYESVVAELRAGLKTGHWMWFVFPQIQGLGNSPTAQKYAISGRPEAEAYLDNNILGPRLRECTNLVMGIDGATIERIFGHPDYLKFRSSMTLFDAVDEEAGSIFAAALAKYFDGERDPLTVKALVDVDLSWR